MSLSPLRAPPHEPHRLQRYVADLARAVGEGLMYLGEAGLLLEEGIRRSAEASGRAADTVARDVTSVVGAVRSVDAEPGFNGIGDRISAAPYSPARVIRRIYENTPTLQNRYRRTSLERRGDLAESLANCAARRLKERQLDAGESFVRSLSSNLLTLYGEEPTREAVMAWARRGRKTLAEESEKESNRAPRWAEDAVVDTYLEAAGMASTVQNTLRERAAELMSLKEKVGVDPGKFENELCEFVDEFVEEGRPIQTDRLDRWTVNSPIREAILRAALEQTPARADPMPAQGTPKTPNEDLHLRTANEVAPARFTAKDIADFNEEVRRVVEEVLKDQQEVTAEDVRRYLEEREAMGAFVHGAHVEKYTESLEKRADAERGAADYQQRIEAAVREAAVAASTPRPVDSLHMGLTPEEADRIVAKWREAYPKMAEYLDRTVETMVPEGDTKSREELKTATVLAQFKVVEPLPARFTVDLAAVNPHSMGAMLGWNPVSALEAGRKALAERPEEVLSRMYAEFDADCARVFEGPAATPEERKEFLIRWSLLWKRAVEDSPDKKDSGLSIRYLNYMQGLVRRAVLAPQEESAGNVAELLRLRSVLDEVLPKAGPHPNAQFLYRNSLQLLFKLAQRMGEVTSTLLLDFLWGASVTAMNRGSECPPGTAPRPETLREIHEEVCKAGRVLPLHLDAYRLMASEDWRGEIASRLEAAQEGGEHPPEALAFVRAGRLLADAGEEPDEDRRDRWYAFEEAVEEVVERSNGGIDPDHLTCLLSIYWGPAGPVETQGDWGRFLSGLGLWAKVAPLSVTHFKEHLLATSEEAPPEIRAMIRQTIMTAAGCSAEEIRDAVARELGQVDPSTPPARSLRQKLTETAAEDASEIALRVAVQRVRGELAERVAAWSARRLAAGDETVRAEQVTFFASPAGQGLITYMLGMGWRAAQGQVDWIPAGPLSERVAREIRLQGGEDLVAGFYREVVAPLISRVQGGAAGFLEEPRTGVRIAQGVSDPRATELARLRTEVAELEAATPGAGARGSRP